MENEIPCEVCEEIHPAQVSWLWALVPALLLVMFWVGLECGYRIAKNSIQPTIARLADENGRLRDNCLIDGSY